jgi:hypothetical protein
LTLEKVEIGATSDNIKGVISMRWVDMKVLKILTWLPSGFALDLTMI